MQPSQNQQPDLSKYMSLFLRWKWLVLIPGVVAPIIALMMVVYMPDEFKSTTLILVQAQKVPKEFVPSTVTTDIQDRLNTISQQILSRTRLEEIIRELNLFSRERAQLSPEEVIALMRSRIELKVAKPENPRDQPESFQLGYVDADPRLAMLVTNKLASLFIEENLKVREQQAMGTSQFLGDEIERVRKQVEEKEQIIYGFKQKHMPELGEQLASNQARLGELQNRLQVNTQLLNAAEDRRLALQKQIAETEQKVREEYERRASESRAQAGLPDTVLPGAGPKEIELARRREELEQLRLNYTPKHPEVLRLEAQVRRLEPEAERERVARAAKASGRTGARGSDPGLVYPDSYDRMKVDLARAEAEIGRLKTQTQDVQRTIETYQGRIAAVPGRELEMKKISQDYENLKLQLDSLVAKKLQADLSENLEKKQKGEQFQILDPANLPEKPFAPNRLRIVGLALAGGLGLGVALVLLLDFLDSSVRTREELGTALPVPVLCAVPEIPTPGEAERTRRLRWGVVGGSAALCLVAALVVHLAVEPLPDAVRGLYARIVNTHWTTIK